MAAAPTASAGPARLPGPGSSARSASTTAAATLTGPARSCSGSRSSAGRSPTPASASAAGSAPTTRPTSARPCRYAVEVLADDDDDQDLDPAAAALSKSRQWVLTALRAGGDLQTVKQLGDRLAQAGHPLKPRTIQTALGELEAAGLAAGSEEGNGRARYWSPATPDDDRDSRGRGARHDAARAPARSTHSRTAHGTARPRMRGVRAPHRRTAHTAHPL